MNISIPMPCHESWETMSPQNQGRFCNACSKIVIDFTQMHDNDIRAFLIQHSCQRICGRFKQHQLTGTSIPIYEIIGHTWRSSLAYAKKLTVITLLLFLFAQPVEGQTTSNKSLNDTSSVTKTLYLGEPTLSGKVFCPPKSKQEKNKKQQRIANTIRPISTDQSKKKVVVVAGMIKID